MLVMNEIAANPPELGGAYFDARRKLLRELPSRTRISMRRCRGFRRSRARGPARRQFVTCFDQRGQLVVTHDLRFAGPTARERG